MDVYSAGRSIDNSEKSSSKHGESEMSNDFWITSNLGVIFEFPDTRGCCNGF